MANHNFERVYRVVANDNLGDQTYWNTRFQDIDTRLFAVESYQDKFDNAADEIIAAGISRINTTFQPLLNTLTGNVNDLSAEVSALTLNIEGQQASFTATIDDLTSQAQDLIAGLSAQTVFASGTFAADVLQLIDLHSETVGLAPTLAQMPLGRLAINTADGILFWRNSAGVVTSYNFINPVAPNQTAGNNSTKVANTAFVAAAISALTTLLLGGTPPTGLNTLVKIAAALNSDPNFNATITAALANRLRFDGAQSLTGTQKTQVRTNLGLSAVAFSGSYTDLLDAPGGAAIAALTQMAALTTGYFVSTDSIAAAAPEVDIGPANGNFSPNFAAFVNGTATMTGNVIVKAPAVFPARLHGTWRSIAFKQDATGGRTLTFDQPGVAGISSSVGYEFDSGSLPAIDTLPNRINRFSFFLNSSGFIETFLLGRGIR